MKFVVTSVFAAILLAPTVSLTAQSAGTGYASASSAQLQITQKTAAAGMRLTRGTYSVRISDRLHEPINVQ